MPSGGGIALVGAALILVPLPFLAIPTGLTLLGLEGSWGAAWALGTGLVLSGVWRMGALPGAGIHRGSPRPGVKLGVAATCFLATGLLIFVGVLPPLNACDPSCPPAGFGGNSSAGGSARCAHPCGSTAGPDATIGAGSLLIFSFVLDALGVLLLLTAVRRAWIAAVEVGRAGSVPRP